MFPGVVVGCVTFVMFMHTVHMKYMKQVFIENYVSQCARQITPVVEGIYMVVVLYLFGKTFCQSHRSLTTI